MAKKKGAKEMATATDRARVRKKAAGGRVRLEPLRVDVPRELKDAIEEYVTEIGSTKTVYIRMLIIADLRAKGKLP